MSPSIDSLIILEAARWLTQTFDLFSERAVFPCTPELTTLLTCFATSGDLHHTGECSIAAKSLHQCMASGSGKAAGAKTSSRGHVSLSLFFMHLASLRVCVARRQC